MSFLSGMFFPRSLPRFFLVLLIIPFIMSTKSSLILTLWSEFESLWHLAKAVMDPQEQAVNVVDVEVEILEKLPPCKTPKKRRAKKPRGPLDVSFPPS
jgi:hypothetical protein